MYAQKCSEQMEGEMGNENAMDLEARGIPLRSECNRQNLAKTFLMREDLYQF